MEDAGAKIIVCGLVQGVGFRYFVYRQAAGLGLRGRVRNLPSGDVEIEVAGNRSLIEELLAQVRVGPRAAHVTNVRVDWHSPAVRTDSFEIG